MVQIGNEDTTVTLYGSELRCRPSLTARWEAGKAI